LNSKKKVRFRRQNKTFPKANFLSATQQQNSEMKRKNYAKVNLTYYKKKVVKTTQMTNNKNKGTHQRTTGK